MIADAKLSDSYDTMDPQFGKQSPELDNFQDLLDSPYVPRADNSSSSGISVDRHGFNPPPMTIQQNASGNGTFGGVDRHGSNPQPMAFQQNASGNGKRYYPANSVILKPSGPDFLPLTEAASQERTHRVEMDIIDDIDRHMPNFGAADSRAMLGKRSYGYGTQPSISPQDPVQKRARLTASPDLSYSETLGVSVSPDPGPPFKKSHRDWITKGLPSRQPFVLTGILLDAFPHCWVRPLGCPVANPDAKTMATFRWCDLLLDATPADLVRLSFRMPTFTMGNGDAARSTMRAIEWTVPLDATWNDVALVISDSTPIDMSKVTFHGRHGNNQCVQMWNRASTVRDFGPVDHQTFDIIGGEVGGADLDQEDDAMELLEDGSVVGSVVIDVSHLAVQANAIHPLFSEEWYEAVADAQQQEADMEEAMWGETNLQPDPTPSSAPTPTGTSSNVPASLPAISKGDRVSVDATVFDGDTPGSYSNFHPGRHYGVVTSFKSKNVARVRWEATKTVELCRVPDLLLDMNYGRPLPRSPAISPLQVQAKDGSEGERQPRQLQSHYSRSTASPQAANDDDGSEYDSDRSDLSDSSRVLREMGIHEARDGEVEDSSVVAEERAAADCAATSSAFLESLQAIGILDSHGEVSPQYQAIMTQSAKTKMESEARRHQNRYPKDETPPRKSQETPATKEATPAYPRLSEAPRRSSRRRQSRPADEQYARGFGRAGSPLPMQVQAQSTRSPSMVAREGAPDQESSSSAPSPGGLRGGARSPYIERWQGTEPSYHGYRRGGEDHEGPEPPAFYSSYPQTNASRSKLRSSILLPEFPSADTGWKTWNRACLRYFGINDLDHVLDEGYLSSSRFCYDDNKLVYYALDQAVGKSVKALSLFKTAPRHDGHSAYAAIYEGYTFSGTASAPILLHQLTSLRMKEGELVSAFILRLVELFEDLEAIPGPSCYQFNDQQKIHHLLAAIRHEKDLEVSYHSIQMESTRGTITFLQACEDLQVRCEAQRADELMASTVGSVARQGKYHRRAMISLESKRQTLDYGPLCLADGCKTNSNKALPLCKLHFAEMVCGRVTKMKLRKEYGHATYDNANNRVVLPASVPTGSGAGT